MQILYLVDEITIKCQPLKIIKWLFLNGIHDKTMDKNNLHDSWPKQYNNAWPINQRQKDNKLCKKHCQLTFENASGTQQIMTHGMTYKAGEGCIDMSLESAKLQELILQPSNKLHEYVTSKELEKIKSKFTKPGYDKKPKKFFVGNRKNKKIHCI